MKKPGAVSRLTSPDVAVRNGPFFDWGETSSKSGHVGYAPESGIEIRVLYIGRDGLGG
jgi:hypothetical protein